MGNDEFNQTVLFGFVDLIITVVAYLGYPLYCKYIAKRTYTEEEARNLALKNTIIVAVCFIVFRLFTSGNLIISGSAAILWGFVSYSILKPSQEKQHYETKKSEKNDPELTSLLNNLGSDTEEKSNEDPALAELLKKLEK